VNALVKAILLGMGIRYWGQPLPAHLVETARTNPRLLSIDDDYDDYLWRLRDDGSDEEGKWGNTKHSLNLDKAFTDFDALWQTEPPEHRPANELVRGWVTNSPWGWKAHYGVIDPDRVAAVRDDIARTRDADIEVYIAADGGRFRDASEAYVRYLIALRKDMIVFLDERLARGEGVLYTIG